MPSDLLPERLKLAIRNLAPHQVEHLQAAAAVRGISGGGVNGWLAALVGMPTPSILADVTAGRTPGYRYQADLARLLGVELAWLHGDDAAAPDWILPALDAWERLVRRIETASARLGGHGRSGEESATEIRVAPADEQRIARLLDLPLGHADLGRLAAGRLAACEFANVQRFNDRLGLATLVHVEHLQRGQEIARIVEARLEQALRTARRRYSRFLLPPRLFQLARLGLVTLKAQRAFQDRDQQTVDDCLEMLWRQQYLRRGEPKGTPHERFTRETGRGGWTPLSRLLSRYADDGDFVAAYQTTIG